MKVKAGDAALRFVSAINEHDVQELDSLMAPDHLLVDSGGGVTQGREAAREAWVRYFRMFPDYAVEIRRVFEEGSAVGLFGTARGAFAPDGVPDEDRRWETPAAWEAEVRDGKVFLWRIFADLDPARRAMT